MKIRRLFALMLLGSLVFAACGHANGRDREPNSGAPSTADAAPEIPADLSTNETGVPILRVYVAAEKAVRKMDAETYLQGVLAGEMRNDWPLEALKAQAILARTFVMQFVSEKDSKYQGADISTDVSEAQAYNEADINDNVRRAVDETRGIVLTHDGRLIHAWFHAHAGGKTELPSIGLDFKDGDPAYLVPVDSPDSAEAPEDVQRWQARFTREEVGQACAKAGVTTGPVERISIAERGASGRVKTFSINGQSVSGPALRIHLDAGKLKSTLIDSIDLEDGEIVFSGRGFGHGVGLSQWGAFALAKDGSTAEIIIRHYFSNVELVRMWN